MRFSSELLMKNECLELTELCVLFCGNKGYSLSHFSAIIFHFVFPNTQKQILLTSLLSTVLDQVKNSFSLRNGFR